MSLRRSIVIARYEFLLLWRDPFWVPLIAMPLLLMAFTKPVFRAALALAGNPETNGAEHAVPGMAVLFSLFVVWMVGSPFFRDYGWHTWERLRASRARSSEILIGKVLPPFIFSGLQLGLLFSLGSVLFELNVRGSLLALTLVSASLCACLLGLGLALATLARTVMQLSVFTNVGALLLAGLGGAIVPVSALPGWAQAVAPVTPGYWAMHGYNAVFLEGGGVGDVALSVSALLGFAAALGGVAAARLNFQETKTSWA